MAQKKEQYDSAADSIFNFIFANNKKNPPFPTPRPTKNISGNEMAYSLGEIASAPAIHASDEALNIINEPLDNISILGGKVKLDSENAVKADINLANASDFFSDPDGFIDKAFTKAEGNKKTAKQLNMIRGLGGIMDLGIGAVAARSVGASSIDSLEMGSVLGSEGLSANYRDSKGEELATRASALEAARANSLDYNAANKQAQIFTSVMESSRLDLADVDMTKINERENHATKRILEKKLQKRGITDQGQIDTLLTKYAEKAEKYKNKKGYDWELGNLDASLTKGKPRGPNRLDEWAKSENPADKLRALKYEELEAEISLLPNSEPRKRQLIGQREHIRNWQLANSHKMRWSSFFGERYEEMQHLNDLVVKGGGLGALVSGGFFDPRQNKFSPSQKENISVNGSKYEDIHIAKENKRPLYGKLTHLYYFTPKSIGRTLFVNGEGFVYLAHLKQEKMRGIIKGSDSIYNYASSNAHNFTPDLFQDVDMTNQKDVLDALAGGENYDELISILQGDRGSITDPELLEILGQMEKMQGKIKNSFGIKYAQKLNDFVKGVKVKVASVIQGSLSKIIGKKAAKFLMGGKVALKKLARGLAKKAVHVLAQALGFATTGGLANILLIFITEAIYAIGEKLLKPLFKLAGAILWVLGVFFLALLITSVQWVDALNPFNNSTQTSFDTAGNTAPIFCEQCGVSGSQMPSSPGDPGGAEGAGSTLPEEEWPEEPPGLSESECPLGDGSLHCSQGPYAPGGSHCHSRFGPKPAIDIAYNNSNPKPNFWHAPSDGQVIHTSYDPRWGGAVIFVSESDGVEYKLVHASAYNVSTGSSVTKGEPIALVNQNLPVDPEYWTGPHWHIEVRDANGNWIDAETWYNNRLNCNLGSCWMGEGVCPHI